MVGLMGVNLEGLWKINQAVKRREELRTLFRLTHWNQKELEKGDRNTGIQSPISIKEHIEVVKSKLRITKLITLKRPGLCQVQQCSVVEIQ